MVHRNVRRPAWVPLAIHLALTVLVIVLGLVLLPLWHVRVNIDKLTSVSLEERERALNFVVRRAGRDQRVLDGAVGQLLEVKDNANFLQIVNALDRARQWRRPPIPNAAWLRWLGVLVSEADAPSRVSAAYLAGQLNDLADGPAVHGLLKALLADTDPQVRSEALTAAALLAGAARDTAPYLAVIANSTTAGDSDTAAQTWIMRGLLGDRSGTAEHVDWLAGQPEVVAARLWAMVYANPDRPQPAIDALQNPEAPDSVRAMAAYCLHMSTSSSAQQALSAWVARGFDAASEADTLIAWRAVLGAAGAAQPTYTQQQIIQGLEHPRSQPIALAALYRGLAPPQPFLDSLGRGGFSQSPLSPVPLLALLEGLPVGRFDVPIPPDTPDLARIAAFTVTKTPDPQDLYDALASDEPTLRDLACVAAMDRLTRPQLDNLAASLLNDFSDNAKRSGGILAGLTGLRTELLEKKARYEDIWPVRQVLRLGLWMQGRLPDMDTAVEAMLTRDDLPTTTVLLAMLHRGRADAWDYLFSSTGQLHLDLIELLDQHRWWLVLKRYLPEGAPPLWVWADAELEAFQLDVLRSWYLLNRRKLLNGATVTVGE